MFATSCVDDVRVMVAMMPASSCGDDVRIMALMS